MDVLEARSLTLGKVIQRNATAYSSRAALITETTTLLYDQLQSHVDTITAHLRRVGLGRGARIAIAIPCGAEAVLAIVAAACGAVAVPIDPRLTAVEIGQRLARLRVAAIIIPRGDSPARAAAEAHNITIFALEMSPHGELEFAPVRLGVSAPSANADRDAPSYILPTSGTIGRQKFVPFSHGNQIALTNRITESFGLSVQDRCLCLSPEFYCYGLSVGILTSLLSGGSIALPSHPANPDLDRWLTEFEPTWCLGGPAIYRAIGEREAQLPAQPRGHGLRFMVSAGTALFDDVRTPLETALGVPILEHYGLTECGMMVTNRIEQRLRKAGTCGKASADTITVVGPDGETLPPGKIGEILVSGPTLTSGYLDDPESNAEQFVDGWFRTGDLGSLDADGFLTIRGRIKDVINRGGEKIMPSEVDAALMGHPAIAEAAAFGTPHPRSGEQVAAAVVLRKGTYVTAADLRDWLAGRLAYYKIPRRIVFLDRLPRGFTGKVQRRELATLAEGSPRLATMADDGRDHAITEVELARLWAELLGREEPIGLDEDFFDIGGDSTLATEMLLELERLIGAPLSDGILYQAPTIRELAEHLSTFAWSEHLPLITVQQSGDQPPLFFCHGDYLGGGFYTRRFARLLGPGQPFYTLPPPPLADAAPSMEQLAAERIPLLLAKQSDRPFRLGGYCNGALLAYEIARQLLAAGRKVEFVLMIDPPSFNARPSYRAGCRLAAALLGRAGVTPEISSRVLTTFSERLGSVSGSVEQFVRAPGPDRAAMVARILPRIYRKLRPERRRCPAIAAENQPLGARTANFRAQRPQAKVLDRRWHRVVASYIPLGLRAPILVFAAAHSGFPWRHLCEDVEIVELPPDHVGCITSHLEHVAGAARGRLAKAAKKGRIPAKAHDPAPLASHADVTL